VSPAQNKTSPARQPSQLHRSTTAVVALLVMAATFAIPHNAAADPAPASTGEPGSISGTVTDTAGLAVFDISVSLFDYAGSVVSTVTPDESGIYSFSEVEPGSYRVGFSGFAYVDEWNDDQAELESAASIELSNGQAVIGIDASLQRLGWIEGVFINEFSSETSSTVRAGGRSNVTTADGGYRIDGLQPGVHNVVFQPRSILGQTHTVAEVVVELGRGTIVNHTAEAKPTFYGPGRIAGTVLDTRREPISRVAITFVRADSGYSSEVVTQPGADGAFVSFEGLADGDYYLVVSHPSLEAPVWYPNGSDAASSTPVNVSGGATTAGVEMTLDVGSISGVVTDAEGEPIPRVRVKLNPAQFGSLDEYITGPDGYWTFSPRVDQNYRLFFETSPSRAPINPLPPDVPQPTWARDFASEWYSELHIPEFRDFNSLNRGTELRYEAGDHLVIDTTLERRGSISGRVTNESGEPIAGIRVSAGYDHTTLTSADGSYILARVDTGSYEVVFSNQTRRYVTTSYVDASLGIDEPTLVTSTFGIAVDGIDAVMVAYGSISGTVTDSAGEPIEGIQVWASSAHPVKTNSSGQYTISGLRAGLTNVFFEDPDERYASEAYDDDVGFVGRTLIPVTLGEVVTGIDAQLVDAASLGGRIVDEAGEPIEGLLVKAANETVETDSDGRYEIRGLVAGDYLITITDRAQVHSTTYIPADGQSGGTIALTTAERRLGLDTAVLKQGRIDVHVVDTAGRPIANIDVTLRGSGCCGSTKRQTDTNGLWTFFVRQPDTVTLSVSDRFGRYLQHWFEGADSFEAAQRMQIDPGSEHSVTIVVQLGAVVSGTLTGIDGAGIANSNVLVESSDGAPVQHARTDVLGRWTVFGLQPGSYVVSYRGDPTSGDHYWGDAATLAEAAVLELGADTVTNNIDITLRPPGSISGTLTNSNGRPAIGVEVIAQTPSRNEVARTTSGADGTYTLDGLANGSYVLDFGNQHLGWVPEYYDNTDALSATSVQVTEGQETTGIDAELVAYGSISGLVTDAEGTPLVGISVVARHIASTTTDADGRYLLVGLDPSSVGLEFSHDEFAFVTASRVDIEVAFNVETAGIDVVMDRGSSIGGTVINSFGEPVVGANVWATPIGRFEVTDETGSFLFAGLAPGPVRLFAGAQFFVKSDTQNLVVEAGADTTDVALQMTEFGTIAGVVRNADGVPVQGLGVRAYESGRSGGPSDVTDFHGVFEVRVPPSTWTVLAIDQTDNYLAAWLGDGLSREDAREVVIDPGAVVSGEITLRNAGAITGTLTNEAGEPLSYAFVQLIRVGGFLMFERATLSGTYRFAGLSPGSYTIRFSDRDVVTEYFDDAFVEENASIIELAVGEVFVADGVLSAEPPKAVLISGSTRPPAGDLAVMDRLTAAGLTVEVLDDDAAWVSADFADAAVVVLASSVRSNSVTERLADVAVPFITWEGYLHDETDLATKGKETKSTYTSIQIANNDHPLTAGLLIEPLAVYSTANKLSYGTPSADATVIATVPGRSGQAVLFTYDPGDRLPSGAVAASCRTALFMDYQGGRRLTAAGVDLVDRAIAAALSCGDATPPPDPPADQRVDADGDTFFDDVDCDDTDATINPGADEIADDGIDQDCDGSDLVTPPDPPAPPDSPDSGTVALFVAGNTKPPVGDLAVVDALLDAGLTVRLIDDDDLEDDGNGLDLTDVAIVVLGSSVKLPLVDDLLADIPVPLLTWEAYLHDENGLASGNRETRSAHSSIIVSSAAHSLTSGLATGSTVVYSEASKLSYGTPSDDATVLATVPGRPDRAVWFVYDPGDELANGTTSLSCRIALFMDYRGGQNLSETGLDLISRSIEYALTCRD